MENFNFKVGDKVTLDYFYKNIYLTVTAIGASSFLATDMRGSEMQCYFTDKWQLYQPTPEKVKLTKFYCSDNDDDFMIKYYKTQSDAPIEWSYVYTEKEFLEKFDVEL